MLVVQQFTDIPTNLLSKQMVFLDLRHIHSEFSKNHFDVHVFTFHWSPSSEESESGISFPTKKPPSLACSFFSFVLCAYWVRKVEISLFWVNSHLKHFQEEVNVKPPHAEALPDDSKQEGDADDEEDGGEEDVDRGEDEQLQKHSHLWNMRNIDHFQIAADSCGAK